MAGSRRLIKKPDGWVFGSVNFGLGLFGFAFFFPRKATKTGGALPPRDTPICVWLLLLELVPTCWGGMGFPAGGDPFAEDVLIFARWLQKGIYHARLFSQWT